MSEALVILYICFDLYNSEKTVIKTNAKKEAVQEILGNWILSQLGRCQDDTKPNKQAVYTITIQLDLSDDSFATVSDTGNTALTCGIIMQIFRNLKDITILDL